MFFLYPQAPCFCLQPGFQNPTEIMTKLYYEYSFGYISLAQTRTFVLPIICSDEVITTNNYLTERSKIN